MEPNEGSGQKYAREARTLTPKTCCIQIEVNLIHILYPNNIIEIPV